MFFSKLRSHIQYGCRNKKIVKNGGKLVVAGLIASSVLITTAYAYSEPTESADKPAVQFNNVDFEVTRAEINQRIEVVVEKLGGNKDATRKLLYSRLHHLEDAVSFAGVLKKHGDIENEKLITQGSGIFIDHTILAANVNAGQIDKLCDEAVENKFIAVCVEGGRVLRATSKLTGTGIKVAAVVGFPLGATTAQSKKEEAYEYLRLGAKELDMVIDIGRIKDGDYKYVLKDVLGVVEAVRNSPSRHAPRPILKVIIECCLLTREEIIDASILCALAGADYVKTSTGFSTHGATEEHVRLMKLTVGNDVLVKAAGGVRDKKALVSMIQQGASRIGTSSGTKLVLSGPEALTELRILSENRS